jgi:hypothetical protein
MTVEWNEVNAYTRTKFIPKLVDNIFNKSVLLNRAKNKWYNSYDGGRVIEQPLEYAQTSAAGWYSGLDTLSVTGNDIAVNSEWQWKTGYASVVIPGTEERKNKGTEGVIDYVKSKMKSAEKTLQDYLGTGLFNIGTDAKAIGGLRFIINTSSTVGGISQTSYSFWQAQLDSTTTTLSLAALNTLFQQCSDDGDTPTMIVTTQTIWSIYWSLLQPQQRFTDAESAKAGFNNLMFNGVPCFWDSHCTSANLFILNEAYLNLFYHPDANFSFTGFDKPVNQDAKIGQVLWQGNLCSSNNRRLGRFSAITA